MKKVILERLKQRFPDLMNEIETRLPTNIAAEMIDNVISKSALQAEAAAPQNAKKIYDSLDKNFGVLSLSETPTDSLLWGYYGDGGYGFLIRVDPQHEWFWAQQNEQDDFRHLRQVAYVATRVPQYLVEIKGADALHSKGSNGSTRENGASFAILTMPNKKWGQINMAKKFCSSQFLLMASVAS